MSYWWSPEILQFIGFALIGGGAIAVGLVYAQRRRESSGEARIGIPGNLPTGPQINMARIPVGGDVGGLVVVIGIVLAFMPMLWGWFLAVGIAAIVFAVALFIWNRAHPW